MALELLLKIPDAYPYTSCADPTQAHSPYPFFQYNGLCAGTKIYFESIAWIESFVYNAAIDRYELVTTNYISNYPGNGLYGLIIHPETGVVESRTYLGFLSVGVALTSTKYNGGLNKLFAGFYFGPYKVVEVSNLLGYPTPAQQANPVVSVTQLPILGASNGGFAVCPERKLITILSLSEGITVYDYSAYPGASVRQWYHPMPEAYPWSIGYENDERIWALFSGSVFGFASNVNQTLLKYNFANNRMELMTELQRGVTPDRDARICFDTKRKKLAAFRVQADDADGAQNNSFEIYAPRPALTQVTVPVAISRLSPNMKVKFRSHLLGTKAEAGALRQLTLENVEVDGILIKTEVPTEQSGSAQFEYTTATDGLTDTITASYDEEKVIV